MDKEKLVEKTTEVLRPFETGNLMNTMQSLNLHDVFTSPIIMLVITGLLFFGVLRRSKPILLTLFGLVGMIIMARYTLPPPGEELNLRTLVPFAFGGVFIGGIIIYFSMIKSD